MRRLPAIFLFLALSILPGFADGADGADGVFAALAAKNDAEVGRQLQTLALAGDVSQLDAVTAREADLFGPKYFPESFMSKLIFDTENNKDILAYLFKAGLPFPTKLPSPIGLDAWKKAVDALLGYYDSTAPNKQNDFETADEFGRRHDGWNQLLDGFLRTELLVPARLDLGDYDMANGYFSLRLSLPALDELGNYAGIIKVQGFDGADLRYYIDRKGAAFFKDRLFAQWTATVVLKAYDRGHYELAELRILNGKDPVSSGLWAFRAIPVDQAEGPSLAYVANYFEGTTITANGAKIEGGRDSTFVLPADGIVAIAALGGPGLLFKGDIRGAADSGSDQILIGGVGPITGPAAVFGNSTKNGYEMAIAEWNAKGGLFGKQIKLDFADDKGDPTEGAIAYTKLIKRDKAIAIVGAVMSKVSLAGAPICQEAGIPMLSPTSTNPKVTQVGDYIFRACFIDPYQGRVGARFAFDKLGSKKAGVLFDVGNDYSKGLAQTFQAEFLALGGQIVDYETHPSGSTDFKDRLSRIIAQKPDILYVPDYYQDDALIAKQARELGFAGPIVGGDGWDSPDLAKIGGAAVENCYFTNHYSNDDGRPIVQDFARKYRAKYGEAPDALAALGYDTMTIMLDAIGRAGSTEGSDVRDALKATDIDVVSGHLTFDANRNPIKSAVIIAIQNGQQVYKTTIDPTSDTATPVNPRSGSSVSSQSRGATRVIKIATQSPLSGGMSAVGVDIKNGAQLALEQLSGPLEKLGFQVELAPFDDQGNPDAGVANARSIVADPAILAVVGHYNSGVQIPSSEEYHTASLVDISPANTNPKVTDRGYAEVDRVCGRDDVQGAAAAQFAATKGIRNAYVLHDKSAYGQGIASYFKRQAEQLGIRVIGFEGTEEKSNFDSILSTILRAKPDAIYFGGMFDQAAVLFKQARQKGYIGMFLSDDGFDASDAARIAGNALTEGGGTYFSVVSGPASIYPGAAKFIADFKAKFGAEPQPFAAQAYDCAAIALMAIEKAAVANGGSLPPRAAVAAAVRDIADYQGITGSISFDSKGDLTKARYFMVEVASADPALWSSNPVAATLDIEPPR
ncbi:MAG TPA: ABC transporter substrate-binding protein [Rectinemataceae bacterium]|nr:ABC transporter substrate-binding protein [Rectinemataceae bacterium]